MIRSTFDGFVELNEGVLSVSLKVIINSFWEVSHKCEIDIKKR